MINSIEDLRSAGVLPTGPCSAWPEYRNVAGPDMQGEPPKSINDVPVEHDTAVKASKGQMARNLVSSARHAMNGRISFEIREERYNICKACPHFIESSKRCSECGCFMEAKTWLNADPDELCPKKKWPN